MLHRLGLHFRLILLYPTNTKISAFKSTNFRVTKIKPTDYLHNKVRQVITQALFSRTSINSFFFLPFHPILAGKMA